MPCRSLPAPGSVIAIAVISSPLAEAGQPALLLLVGGEVAQVRRRRRRCAAPKPTPLAPMRVDLLVEDGVVAEVADPAAAVLLLDVHPEQPLLAAGEPHLARDDAVLLPLVVEGDDGLLRPGPDHRPGSRRARPRTGSGACHPVCPSGLTGSIRDLPADCRTPVDTGRRVRTRPVLRGHPGLVHRRVRAADPGPGRARGTRSAAASTRSSSPPPARARRWRPSCGRSTGWRPLPPPAEEQRRCRVLYVSPLKALAVDVERNLRAPADRHRPGRRPAGARRGRRSGSASAPATPRPTSGGRSPAGPPTS